MTLAIYKVLVPTDELERKLSDDHYSMLMPLASTSTPTVFPPL
eukprot:CAMPEP_0198693344 /NCGR_PEP_ID=MMETSP1468-20131203/248118_1 /TAXON_ID=1461545 /ORGANISM="Mantoniella sp, Strain CCMP1436" /LENGTH=42 /DNA_ID= /DNA_START= /DNA_END= /DNA_ORIENTATION=